MQSLGPPEQYRREATWAESQMDMAKDRTVKAAWERVVVGYLELADLAERRDRYRRDFPGLGL